MGLTFRFNPAALEAAISQHGERAVKGMSEKMRKIAIRIRDLARSYAPRKTGLLEEEIHYSSYRDAKRRNAYVIWIDMDAARRNAHARGGTLGDYAFIMEEQLTPAGPLKLGKGSVDKATGGRKVGGRFLARAVEDATANIEEELAEEVRRVLG